MAGIVFSTLAGFCWAVAIVIYKKNGDSFSPVVLNLIKSVLALILILPIMFLSKASFFPDLPLREYIFVSVSGILGIAVADSLFFSALKRVGAGFMAIIDCLYLPSILLTSFILLDEKMGILGISGAILVFTGIFLGSYSKGDMEIDKKDMIYGTVLGCSAIFLIAVSIVGIKDIINHTNPVWVTFLRNGAGIVALLVMMPFNRNGSGLNKEIFKTRDFKNVFIGGVFNFMALLFWITGMKYAMVSLAAILNQLSIVFIYILAVFVLKEKATKKKTFAVILALTGAILAILNDRSPEFADFSFIGFVDIILQRFQ